jgi:hypothetical protein
VSTTRVAKDGEVLAALRREAADLHYAYAPGRVSIEGLAAALAIAGFARGPAATTALRAALDRLVAAGQARPIEVSGPDGAPTAGWYEPVD